GHQLEIGSMLHQHRGLFVPVSYLFMTAALATMILAGCSRVPHSQRPSGKVEAKVTYGGQPVKEGFLNLSSQETGLGGGADIGSDGIAIIESVPVGTYVVTVTPPVAQIANPNLVIGDQPDLPMKFRSESTSTLT